MKDINERLSFFCELITCSHNISYSAFNSDFQNIYCSNDMVNALYLFLSIDELDTLNQMPSLKEKLTADMTPVSRPAVCTNSLGMLWISECEYKDDILHRIHVLGPVFTTDYSQQNINQRIEHLGVPVSMKKNFLGFVKTLPVIPVVRMHEYGSMLHYCLYGEKISIQDLVYLNPVHSPVVSENPHKPVAPEQIYFCTVELLDMIENGNLEYKEALNHLASIGYLADYSDDFLRQSKNAIITLTALCCHAAIRGGLSPSTAYLLSDKYLRQIEKGLNISTIGELGTLMLQDYTKHVHQLKYTNSSISPQIQSICDRLTLHPEEAYDIRSLASGLGYSEYYFSRKFRQETGKTIKEYLLEQKLEKSKLLLKSTSMSVQDIAESLGFCSPSYFGKLFKKAVGMSPGDFRS